ncbi:MAG: histidine phosphatase family protein [Planctomycetales bacterium]|nr:histidine phosphatase family protein [Planctomycetales bacterium]
MKRRLIVMRHAKSSWANPDQTDHDRPLNKRGLRDAPRVAAKLAELGWVPDFVLSSDAVRTRQTYRQMQIAFPDTVLTEFTKRLYHGGVTEFLSAVSQLGDLHQTVLVLGHNPGWEHVVHYLTDHPIIMKTSTAALIETPFTAWQDLIDSKEKCSLVDTIYARDLELG